MVACKQSKQHKVSMQIINKEISKSDQGVHYIEYLKIRGSTLRIEIYSDAYQAQSYCKLYAFSNATMTWNLLIKRCPEKMKTKEGLCYLPNGDTHDYSTDFETDRQWLICLFKELIKDTHLDR
jgi:hypothetical protein